MFPLSKEEHEEFIARYPDEVNAKIIARMDEWKDSFPEKRKVLRARLRKQLESELLEKVRASLANKAA
jgi:hypothetical protein